MRKPYIFFLTPFALLSCSERTDIYSEMNTPPAVTVAGEACPEGTVYRDTLKLGSSWERGFSIADETGAELQVLFYPDNSLAETENGKIKITPSAEGDMRAEFAAEDGFGSASSFAVELHVFRNIPPVVSAEAYQDAEGYDPFEFYVDASASYDTDGEIAAYRYKIENNYEKTLPDPVLRYIPETGGQKKISVQVQDSDGEWSEPAEIYITLK